MLLRGMSPSLETEQTGPSHWTSSPQNCDLNKKSFIRYLASGTSSQQGKWTKSSQGLINAVIIIQDADATLAHGVCNIHISEALPAILFLTDNIYPAIFTTLLPNSYMLAPPHPQSSEPSLQSPVSPDSVILVVSNVSVDPAPISMLSQCPVTHPQLS